MPTDRLVVAVATPRRSIGAGLIAAKPADGAPVVLPPTAATVLIAATGAPVTTGHLDGVLADTFPDVDAAERHATLAALIDELLAAGLLERR